MDGTSGRSDATVGQRLKEIRLQRGLTLSQVSALSKVSVSTLSRLENGLTSLNFNNVLQLIEGLNIPISSLIGPREVSHSGRKSMTPAGQGRYFETDQLVFEVLCGELTQKRNVFWRVQVKARSFDDYEDYKRHPGEEFIFVLKGRLILCTELYEDLLLEQGDSIFFDSAMGHAYVSAGRGDTEILMSNSISRTPLEGFDDAPTPDVPAEARATQPPPKRSLGKGR